MAKTSSRNRNERLGRNDPCFCGSGLKYKKCCLPKQPRIMHDLPPDVDLAELERHFEKMETEANQRTAELHGRGIFISLPNTIGFKGKRLMAVGNKIMYEGTENSTFHDLLLKNLQHTLGREWWDAETAKPEAERHFIRRCYSEWNKFTSSAPDKQQEANGNWSATPNGYAHSLLSLAFDVWLLTHKDLLPDDWLRRLRTRDQYQGVRYELGVASIFVRIGCTLEFYEDRRGTAQHPEFKAYDQQTGARVGVEAKSRHRLGVLHQGGAFNERKAIRGDVTGLFNAALEKDSEGLPYIIFLDVNTPTDVNTPAAETRWYRNVRQMIERQHESTPNDPDQYSLVAVTNYSHHYQGPDTVSSSQTCIILPLFSQAPLPGGQHGFFLAKLQAAIGGYGYVPNL